MTEQKSFEAELESSVGAKEISERFLNDGTNCCEGTPCCIKGPGDPDNDPGPWSRG